MGYKFNLAKIDIFSRIYKVYHWKVINNFMACFVANLFKSILIPPLTSNKKSTPVWSASLITILLKPTSSKSKS